jgi:hypothetical protein
MIRRVDALSAVEPDIRVRLGISSTSAFTNTFAEATAALAPGDL